MLSTKRITSIDALRAFALLGILLVHTAQLYNFYQPTNNHGYFTMFDNTLRETILYFFENKCRTIFSILFGTSFYLILRNPNNNTKRFCWRCFILMGFGFINQLFFTTDILMCYGFTGILLALLPFRRRSTLQLLVIAAMLYCVQFFEFLKLDTLVFPQADYSLRYSSNQTVCQYLSYPIASILKDSIHTFFPSITTNLSFFIFGYAIGRSGYIEHIYELTKLNNLCIIIILTIILRIICKWADYPIVLRHLANLSTSFCYALLFVRIHKHTQRFMSPFEYYGKLGLTNYSTQNIFCPLLILSIGLPFQFPFYAILSASIVFYLLQVLFAMTWLRFHRYGPWEFLWRKITNLPNLS